MKPVKICDHDRPVLLLGTMWICFGLAALPAVPTLAETNTTDQHLRPNVILILCDDLGYSDLGCYGGEIATPNLDRLASSGLLFTHFYNQAKCTETRATLLTGLYHQQTNNMLRDNHVTLAEVLKSAGYMTLMSGKWHVGRFASEQGTPDRRGFDRSFTHLGGAIDYFSGIDLGSRRNLIRLDGKSYEVPDDFYATDTLTDYAIDFVNQAAASERPFFLYLAYNAPHFPLQAPPDDIEHYRGRYKIGWDEVRKQRHQRMIELGLVDPRWRLSPRDPMTPDWDALTPVERDEEDLLMATYAAMVDRMDRQIGRLMDRLETLGATDNTVVMFLADNGGCPFDHNHTPNAPPGPRDSRRSYDTEWAQVSNTPLRLYKQWVHEGGSATPMIVRWPAAVKGGRIVRAPAHLIDIMPTLVELSGTAYPTEYNGYPVLAMEGRSLTPIFDGADDWDRGPMFWEYRGSHAVRDGAWKLVAERGKPWELYDLTTDRTETRDLIGNYPRRARAMAAHYDRWAERIGARTHARSVMLPPNGQDRYLYDEEKTGQ